MEGKKNVAILLFDGVEILDVAGPAEVFSSHSAYQLHTLAPTIKPVNSGNGIKLMPSDTYQSRIKPDILIVPGGQTPVMLGNNELLSAVKALSVKAELILSVCTGALLLAKVGLLEGLAATTYHTALAQLKRLAPTCEVIKDRRFVDCGRIVTTAGVSAGLDGALHIIQRQKGAPDAARVATYMEYRNWHETDGLVRNFS
jgi:transcriptional regulator GlxA family with amidase domain